MALNINGPETDRLARRLSTLPGESITLAVKTAVRERIEREERSRGKASVEELLATARRIAEAPNLDGRSDDEILGYDDGDCLVDDGRQLSAARDHVPRTRSAAFH